MSLLRSGPICVDIATGYNESAICILRSSRSPPFSILRARLLVARSTRSQRSPPGLRVAAQNGLPELASSGDGPSSSSSEDVVSGAFCIIEGPETVQDFAKLQLQEIRDNIKSRRNKIFLLMEEVRRLRIQQRIKSAEHEMITDDENEMPSFPSFIPFLPPLSLATLKQYYLFCCGLVAAIILFGGLLAPTLELKLGLGGTSYEDFIRSMNLPAQLSEVDPIVASFSGGAVGVISSLMLVEVNNVKQQEHKRCIYCHGTGYLACARCSGTGAVVVVDAVSMNGSPLSPLMPPVTQRCPNCSGSTRVMCPTCLCTGTAMLNRKMVELALLEGDDKEQVNAFHRLKQNLIIKKYKAHRKREQKARLKRKVDEDNIIEGKVDEAAKD